MNGRTCECTGEFCGRHKDETCGGPAYSWSQDHQNQVLCSACYNKWLKLRKILSVRDALASLGAEDKKLLKEMMA